MKNSIQIGNMFGYLTVYDNPILTKFKNNNRFMYPVQCACGNKFLERRSRLINNEKVCCTACSFKFRSINVKKVTNIHRVFKRYVIDRAKNKNIECTLTLMDFEKIATSRCYYCGDEPKEIRYLNKGKYFNNESIPLNGVDRLDSSLGYTLENSVPCCTSCNYAKHKLNVDEFKNKIIKIYKNLNLGNESGIF